MIKFNEATPLSKWVAIVFFILVLPVLCFYIGKQYEQATSIYNIQTVNQTAVKTDASTWKTYTNAKYGFSVEYPTSILKAPTVDESQKDFTHIVFANIISDPTPDLQKIGQIIQPRLEIDINDIASYGDPGYSQSADYYKINLSGGHSGFLPKEGGAGARNFIAAVKLDDGSFLSASMDKRKIVACEKDSPCAEAVQDEATAQIFSQILATFKFGM